MGTKFAQVSIERVQGYWDHRPCNIRHSPRPMGSKKYFDEVEARKYFVESHIPRFAEFERWRGKDVLEIGCGIGTDTINFARAGALVTAVDLSEESLKVARLRAEVFDLTDMITFYQANAEELSEVVPPKPFDLVYSFGVIHHTPHPELVMTQIRDHYARPGSTVKIMVYHRYSWKVLWLLLKDGKGQFWRLHELVPRNSEAQTGCPITYTFTARGVRDLLESYGMTVTQIWVDHIFPYRIPDYLQHRYVKKRFWTFVPLPIFRWLEHQLGWHICITATVPS